VSPRHVLATSALAVGAASVLGAPAAAAAKPAAAHAARAMRPYAHPHAAASAQATRQGPRRPDANAGQGTAAVGVTATPLPGPVADGIAPREPDGAGRRAAALPGGARAPPRA
jgi:hypothetical protein